MKKTITLIAALMVLMLSVTAVNAEEAAPSLENVALDKMVYAVTETPGDTASIEGTNWFSAAWLTDGEVPVWGGPEDTETHICWYCVSAKRETDILVYIDLEDDYDITEVRVIPTTFLNGMNMPAKYEIVISDDGDEWTTVAAEESISDGTPYSDPFVYQVNRRAAYVGLRVLKSSAIMDTVYYSGLGEIEVIAAVTPKTPKPTAEPTEEPAATEVPAATDVPGDNTRTDSDNNQADANGDNASADKDSGSSKTPVVIGIVAGVAVIAAVIAGVVISKSKKK